MDGRHLVADVIDDGRVSGQQFLVVVLCLLLNMLDGFDITAMAVVASGVAADLALTPDRLGWIFSFALAGMMAGAVLLLSPVSAAVAQTLVKRHGAHVSSVVLNRNGLLGGAVLLLAVALATERGADLRWTGSAIFSIVYLSIVGTVVTFGLFFWLLRYAAAHRLSLIAYVIPVVALFLGLFAGYCVLMSVSWQRRKLLLWPIDRRMMGMYDRREREERSEEERRRGPERRREI